MPEYTDHGAIPVDTGRILLVDPTHIPDDLLRKLTTPNEFGVTVGIMVGTPDGDGAFNVTGTPCGLEIDDPCAEEDDSESRWSTVAMPEEPEFPAAVIRKVTIINGARIARVTNPITGDSVSHGLGAVGEPIRPYLGHRAEGYVLALPESPYGISVIEVDTAAPADARGLHPSRRVPAYELGASDVIRKVQ